MTIEKDVRHSEDRPLDLTHDEVVVWCEFTLITWATKTPNENFLHFFIHTIILIQAMWEMIMMTIVITIIIITTTWLLAVCLACKLLLCLAKLHTYILQHLMWVCVYFYFWCYYYFISKGDIIITQHTHTDINTSMCVYVWNEWRERGKRTERITMMKASA